MSKAEKTLERMKNNPKADWGIHDLIIVAERFNIEHRQPRTSHVTFRAPNGERLTVPSHKPIKPAYIRAFVAMIETLEEQRHEYS